ncbi:MAG: serine hydrolase domain-containing protein [Polyangiaceae bacterium]
MRSKSMRLTEDPACSEVAHRIVASGVAPLAAGGFATSKHGIFAGGSVETIFDLASLTKPMTAVAVARSSLSRHEKLGDVLPETKGTASDDATIELLLSHRAGLEPHVKLWLRENMQNTSILREAADARRADAKGPYPEEGFAPVYSDLGYLLAGAALARRVNAVDAGAAIDDLVVVPLGLEKDLGTARDFEARGIDVIARSAPTEDAPWRGGMVQGRVHDENAWAITKEGGSGHAGMFGTIAGVLAFGLHVLENANAYDWLVRARPGGSLRAGFDGKSDAGSSAGTVCGPRTFGHLGFTGTSLWIDPESEIVVALLTNRVHPSRENTAIREARPEAHDALFRAAKMLGSSA